MFNPKDFSEKKIKEISNEVGDGLAMNALSGGVDSSVTTMLGHKAIGKRLITYFIDTGFMRKKEPGYVKNIFAELGIGVKIYNASNEFFAKLKGLTNGEEKRIAFSDTFYEIFGKLIKENKAEYLLQGTNAADKKMFAKGQSQHNVRTSEDYRTFGIEKILEPLDTLYKPHIRELGKELGLPEELYSRPPFPGPGLLVRCLGEATPEKIKMVREAQAIAEEELAYLNPSLTVACISGDTVTGMAGKKAPGKYMIFIRALKTEDYMTAKGIYISEDTYKKLEKKITEELPDVAHVLLDPTDKPPATMEYI